MPKTTVWKLEAHTAAKHRMLEKYLEAWFPIMATRESKILYLDAFAGPGRYSNGDRGSPLIALDVLLNHAHFDRWSNTKFLFQFLEPNKRRAANLEEELDRKPIPKNVRWGVDNTTFAEGAEEILGSIGKNQVLVPTFAFIDPFGWKGIPIDLIRRLLAFDKCELLINFMLDPINRWATAQNTDTVHQRFRELFGTDEFTDAPATGAPRRQFLVDLYKRQLQARGFPYVRSLDVVSNRNRTVYHLVHGTRHLTGVKAMKRAMWALDTQLGRRFTPFADEAPTLFGTDPDLSPLRTELIRRFRGRTVSIETVEAFVTEHTDFMADSHLKKVTLKPMEQDGLITSVKGRNRAGSFPPFCQITFAA